MPVINWLSSNWQTLAIVAMGVVTGASVALHAIAPLTKTERDDRLYGWLVKVESWLGKLALNRK